jgi:hypothetical protein
MPYAGKKYPCNCNRCKDKLQYPNVILQHQQRDPTQRLCKCSLYPDGVWVHRHTARIHAKRDLQDTPRPSATDVSVLLDDTWSISSTGDRESTSSPEHHTFSELPIDNVGDRTIDGEYQRISVDELEDEDWQRLDDMDWQTDFDIDRVHSAIGTPIEKLALNRDSDTEDSGDSELDDLKLEDVQIPKGTENNVRLSIILYLN